MYPFAVQKSHTWPSAEIMYQVSHSLYQQNHTAFRYRGPSEAWWHLVKHAVDAKEQLNHTATKRGLTFAAAAATD